MDRTFLFSEIIILILILENTGELATWERFTRFYKQDTEVDSLVAGYGVLDYFVEVRLRL